MALLHSIMQFLLMYGFLWWIFVIVERLRPAHAQPLLSKHSAIELGHGVLNYFVISQITAIISTILALYLLAPFAPYHIFSSLQEYPFWLQFAAILFLRDLTQYTRHRFTHRFLWSCHTTHHAATQLRSTTHFRQHPFDYVVSVLFDALSFYILGFEAEAVIWATWFMQVHNMWLHVNVNLDYGPYLRHFFVSPNYHKWHHARAKEAVDKNFADLFVILDVVGGTRYYPLGRLPEAYGVLGVPAGDPLHQSFWGALIYPWRQAKSLFKKY